MAGFFDIFRGSGNNFYFRDAKNANRFRPDANPVRQKFQGYVNFIFNRDLFEDLYVGGNQKDPEFRTTIGSLVRTAQLPSASFQTEVMNAYNRKRIVQTGVEYNPVEISVYDTVGNEWLTTLMKYFAYHYMDPRNRSEGTRDLDGSRRVNDAFEKVGSYFGLSDKWNSNQAGFNLNITQHFFERIDYVLYHGNRGIQYSLFNPTMKEFNPGDIDYSDNTGFREFTMSFDYEAFTIYDELNFDLSQEDLDRFEDLSEFNTISTFQAGRKAYTLGENTDANSSNPLPFPGFSVRYLGIKNTSAERFRSFQSQFNPSIKEWTQGNPDGSENGGFSTPRRVYLGPTVIGGTSNTLYTGNPFRDTLINVADSALSAAINGGDVRDAALGAALGGIVPVAGDFLNRFFGSQAIEENSPNKPPPADENGNAPIPGG
jgi:hypothetical protein